MTPVAIVSPATAAATQGAAPQGAAAPGGAFAALFAAIAGDPTIGQPGPAGAPADDAGAKLLAFLHGVAPHEDGEPPPAKDGDAVDDATALFAAAPPPVVTNDRPATPASPAMSAQSVQAMAMASTPEPEPLATKDTAANLQPAVTAPTQDGEPALSRSAAAQTDAPVQPVLPAQIAAPAKPVKPVANESTDASPIAADDSAPDSEASQTQPAAPAKKPAPTASDAKPAAETKPAPAQTASGGAGTGTIFVATASPDSTVPMPTADPSVHVKTVPLSNLANLTPGAAVTAIGAVIASEAAAGTNRFLIRLDPPELGRIDVRLRFGRDGEVHARLIADRPETANLLMRDAAALERALNASGMRTDSGVDVMLRDSSGGFARNDGGFGNDAPPAPYGARVTALESMSDAPVWIRPAAAGRLDLTV